MSNHKPTPSPFQDFLDRGCAATPELFAAMCAAHDLTYDYSDDFRAYQKGARESSLIQQAATLLGNDVAFPIWNAEVDKKLLEGSREMFYWRKPNG